MDDITLDGILAAASILWANPEILKVFGYMFAASMLVGGMLDWTPKAYWLYAFSALVGIFFVEWIRVEYFHSINEIYSSLPAVMALTGFTLYSLGIFAGYEICVYTRKKNPYPLDDIEDLAERVHLMSKIMKKQED